MGADRVANFINRIYLFLGPAAKLIRASDRIRLHVSPQELHRMMIFSQGTVSLADRVRGVFVLLSLFAAAAALSGCHKPAPAAVADANDPSFVVAGQTTPTGTWTITRGDLNKQIDAALAQQGATRDQVPAAQLPKVEVQILRYMVVKKLLLDKAATMKLPDIDKQVAQAIDLTEHRDPNHTYTDAELAEVLKSHGMTLDQFKQNLHDMAMMQAVLDAGVAQNIEPTEQEIDAIYNQHKDAFNVPPMIRASRVLILVNETDTPAQKAEKQKKIAAARARVMKGEDFSKVAMEISEDRSSAPRGGDMGKFPVGENEPDFDKVAFKTKVNSVSPVFLDSMGYQFVKVTDSSPAGVISLAEARAMIAPKLRDMKKQQAENLYAQNLLTNSGVTFYLHDLDPTAMLTNAPSASEPDQSAQAGPDQSATPQVPEQATTPQQAADQGASTDTSTPPTPTLSSPSLSATNTDAPQQPSM
jgi:parvulin-like peptidyl-prolyl isomerase